MITYLWFLACIGATLAIIAFGLWVFEGGILVIESIYELMGWKRQKK